MDNQWKKDKLDFTIIIKCYAVKDTIKKVKIVHKMKKNTQILCDKEFLCGIWKKYYYNPITKTKEPLKNEERGLER